jgi:8-oxo-dGTP diphosphatase
VSEEPPKHSVSVAGIVINDRDEVLVIKRRDNGHWEMPGGILELGETFEQGVIREVHEETGITVTVERLTGIYKNMTQGIVALVFRCRPGPQAPHPTDEVTEVRWIPRDLACDNMNPAFAIRVNDAFDSTANVRVHDGVNFASGGR